MSAAPRQSGDARSAKPACGLGPQDEHAVTRASAAGAQPPSQHSCTDCGKGGKYRFHSSEEYAFEKARGMIRMGKSDAFISDYLGMVEEQVASIRRDVRARRQGRPSEARQDIAEPFDDSAQLDAYAFNCRQSSEALARAIGRLG